MPDSAALKAPPGPAYKSWSGAFKEYSRDPLAYLPRIAREYGDIVAMRYYTFRVFFINHPDFIEDVLVTHSRKFEKGRILRANKRVFGEGLLTSEGDFWLRQRRLAQPAFHRARIAAYADTMVSYTDRLLREWKNGQECDVHAEMMRLTLQIVAKTLFDADVDQEVRQVGHALESLMELNANFRKLLLTPSWLPTPTNIRSSIATRQLNKIIYRIINERRATGRDAGDLLSMLLAAQDEDGSRMSDQQLRDESMTIFLAGHETTANALSWTWYLLSKNPSTEEKLHEEIDRVLAGRLPTLGDLPNLRYTGHVVTESLRLYPPAWGMPRLAIEDVEIGGYTVPKGSGVTMSQWVVHRDPRWFDQPDEFQPERWAGDLAKRLPRFAYFPFGGGPRQCIGNSFALMEAALILATIAQRFRVRVLPDCPVVPLPSITLRPKNGIRVLLESRSAAARKVSASEVQPTVAP
ncbi:MAG TPA: cytochrome P450 [Candidatus Acidoferrum sp.]|jgi:cytochrome P450